MCGYTRTPLWEALGREVKKPEQVSQPLRIGQESGGLRKGGHSGAKRRQDLESG